VYADSVEHGTIVEVLSEGRRLRVRDADGAVVDFALLRATARYTSEDGRRISFEP
jgi:hypothetical protein